MAAASTATPRVGWLASPESTGPGRLSSAQLWSVLVASAVLVGGATAVHPLAGVAGLGAAAGALAVLRNPALGAVILISLVPVLSGVRRGFPIPGVRLSELVIVGVAGLILLTVRSPQRWRRLDWVALLYVGLHAGLGVFDLAQRHSPFTASNLGTLAGPLQYFLIYRATVVAASSQAARAWILRWMLLASVPVSLLSLLQAARLPGLEQFLLELTGAEFTDLPLLRVTGPFPHWHLLAGYLFVIVLVGTALLLSRQRRVLPRGGLLAVVVPAAAGITATLSIAPMFGTLAGVVALVLWSRRARTGLPWLAAGIVIIGVVFATEIGVRYESQFGGAPRTTSGLVPQTIAFRYDVWTRQYLPAVSNRLLTGWGPCCASPEDRPPEVTWSHTESLYIMLLLRGGVPLVLAYAGLMIALAALALALVRNRPESVDRALARAMVVLLGVLVALHLVMPYFVDVGLPHLLWALAGLCAAAASAPGRTPAR